MFEALKEEYDVEKMRMSKFRIAVSIAILAIALLTVYFLVQDIYRLQKEYEIVSAPLDLEYRRMNEDQYRWIRGQLDEIQTMINLRKTAVVLVVAATAVTLLVLNKRKLFKEKYAVKFKFAVKFAVLVLIVAMICAIGVVCFDIMKIKARLDKLYWIAENTHSFVAGIMIERAELLLNQKLMLLTALVVVTILIIVGLILVKYKFKPELTTLEACSPPSPN